MKNNKNVDRLFQEKFKDFEMAPDNVVWDNIETILREKKNKKRIIPIWFKLSGIAAGLIIGFILFTNNFEIQKKNNEVVNEGLKSKTLHAPNANNTIVKAEKTEEKNSIQDTKIVDESENKFAKDAVVNQTKTAPNSRNTISGNTGKKNNSDILIKTDESVTQNTQLNSRIITESSIKSERKPFKNKLRQSSNSENNASNAVANAQKRSAILKKRAESRFNNANELAVSSDKSYKKKDKIIQNSSNLAANKANEELVNSNGNSGNQIISATMAENKSKTIDSLKNVSTAVYAKKTDSIALASVTKNPLQKLLEEKESEKKKNITKPTKWQVTSNVAPVFFNSTSNDSPIDPSLNSYNKSFENNISLGIGMGYAVSKNLTIRSGINRFTMAYTTNDILFRPGMARAEMKNMTSANNGVGIEIMSRSDFVQMASSPELSPQNVSEGVISQRMGYFEVPLEMSYAVVNKKFGIDLIGGFSTLFVAENEISMRSGSMSTTLGKASNLRDVHFSSNIGIGLRYRFWKSFQARIEPTFKYQINTFTDNSVAFRPYFIGVYSGIVFGF